jgi:hypothetical protein
MASDLIDLVRARLYDAMEKLARDAVETIRDSLSVQGSVVPFVVSRPGEPPYNWDNRMIEGIGYFISESTSTMTITFVSNAFDDSGRNFAADEEGGHWWDGWAQDFEDNYRWVKISEPHEVAPRPYMAPQAVYMAQNAPRFLAQYFGL